MANDSKRADWSGFKDPAAGFLSLDYFERQERGYKLEVAEAVELLGDTVRAGGPVENALKDSLRHKENNLLPWRLKDDALKWSESEPETFQAALEGIFDEDLAPLEALSTFLDRLPRSVVSGQGSRLALGSFLLMGRSPESYPIYRSRVIAKVRKLARWESEAENEIEEYEDALAMFGSFRRWALTEGLKVESPLHAQGILYAIAQWEPDADWPNDLRTSVVQLRKDRGMAEPLSFKSAIAEYDRANAEDKLESASEQRASFVARFPASAWPTMPVESYALGTDTFKDGVSYALEWGTPDCGSISGGSANKHLLYFSDSLGSYKFESKYNSSEEAWEAIRGGVVELADLAAKEDFSSIDEIDSLWAAPAVRLKLAWLYFPDRLLPIYSDSHLDFWLSIFNIEDKKLDRVAKNRALLEELTSMEEFEGWQTLEIMHFLYSWTNPGSGQTILKIAAGEGGVLWEDFRKNSRVRLGFDGIGDLSQFDSDDEIRAHYSSVFPDDNKSVATRTIRALRTFRDLSVGDIILANQGTKTVLGIGRVTNGYEFHEDLDNYRHVVQVEWFDTRARSVDFGSAWMFTLVPVKADDYHRILRDTGPAITEDTPLPAVPPLHREAERLLERSGQVIFYGPPGTGKTYAARRHAAWLLGGGSANNEAARAFGSAENLAEIEAELLRAQATDARPSWLIVANPSYWSFDELFEKGSEDYDFGRLKKNFEEAVVGDEVFGYEATPNKKVVATARISKALYTTESGKEHIGIEPSDRITKPVTYEMLKDDAVLASSQPVSFGMQGTLFRLEPHEASRLRSLAGLDGDSVGTGVPQLTRVTFHPTYSYEDFIEGYKPTESGAGGLELSMRDGVFKKVCRAAAADPDKQYVLMIDEINRGNVPKIFGELITLIEKDKRGMPLILPQSGESFHVPANVQIVATMNTADRSIHILDAALRRRFAFVELMPDASVLTTKVGPLPLDSFLGELNNRIRDLVGREKQVGHAVLMKAGEPLGNAAEFALSFKYELLPLLQEYTYGNYNDLAELLGNEVVDEEKQLPNAEILDDPERLIEALAKHLELG